MTLLLVIFYFSDYVCTLLLQTIVVKCDYVPKKCKHFYSCSSPNNNFFSNYQHLVVVFTAALSPSIAIHSLNYWHISQIIIITLLTSPKKKKQTNKQTDKQKKRWQGHCNSCGQLQRAWILIRKNKNKKY